MSLVERANQLLAALLANPSVLRDNPDTGLEVEQIWYLEKWYTPVQLAAKMARELSKEFADPPSLSKI